MGERGRAQDDDTAGVRSIIAKPHARDPSIPAKMHTHLHETMAPKVM